MNDDLTKAKAAVQATPEDPQAWLNLGRLLQVEGETDKAEQCFQQVKKLTATTPLKTSQQAAQYFREGNLAQAQTLFAEALVLWSEFVNAHDLLGQCYLQSRQVERAVAQWKERICHNPDHIEVRRQLAQEFYR